MTDGHALAPRAKVPTPEEAQERRDAMFELQEKIKESASLTRAEAWKTAAYLDLFDEAVGWSALGYESLNEWLADPAGGACLGMGRTRFYDLIAAYRELTKHEVDPAVIQTLEVTKVVKCLPAVKQGRAKLDDVLDDVQQLSYSDLREKYRDPASVGTSPQSAPASKVSVRTDTPKPALPPDEEPTQADELDPDQDDLIQRESEELDDLIENGDAEPEVVEKPDRLEKAKQTLEQIDVGINAVSEAMRLHALRMVREFILEDYPEAAGDAG